MAQRLKKLRAPTKANNTEDYVHRIGRTGRAGAKGYAVTFLCPSEDGGKVSGIIQVGCLDSSLSCNKIIMGESYDTPVVSCEIHIPTCHIFPSRNSSPGEFSWHHLGGPVKEIVIA